MSQQRLARAGLIGLAIAVAFSGGSLLAGRRAGPLGLRLTAAPEPGAAPEPPRRVPFVDLRDLHMDARLARARHATWEGFWRVPADGRYKLVAEGRGPITVNVDGDPVLAGQGEARLRGRIELAAGLHAIAVDYERPEGPDQLRLRWARSEETARDFETGSLFADRPSPVQMRWSRAATVLSTTAGLAWGLLLAGLAFVAARGDLPGGARRVLRVALPALVVVYAGVLRFDALVGRYAWEGPPWALEAQRAVEGWRSDALAWSPEPEITGGDPFNYVHRARTMRGFYDADAREPLFPTLTRVALRLLGDRILAVHVASAACSTLVVLATYLLGAVAFSRAAGLLAALGMALDRDALWWSVEGFRDDAFTLFVLLSAAALVRLLQRPTARSALLAGLAGAAGCLTRITSLSYLVPAYALLLLGRGEDARARRRAVGLAALVTLALVGPFLLTCTIAYGDPFYAVNFHTKFYRSRSGLDFQQSMGWLDYLRTNSLGQQITTGLRGLTTYPFGNKWQGLAYLSPWLVRPLAVLSLGGLALFLRSREGRLLLALLATSLLPYAFTWTIPGGAEWRFTMHAYPFYLVAAGLAIVTLAGWLRRLRPAAS